jgi:anti-sigma B factor antagonist
MTSPNSQAREPLSGRSQRNAGPGGPELDIAVEKRGASVRIELRGELDMAGAVPLRERLKKLEADGPELLLIDLRKLGFMDSSGLREIAAAVRRGRLDGRRVVLVKSPGPIDSVLAITRVDLVFETVEDPAAVGFDDGGS